MRRGAHVRRVQIGTPCVLRVRRNGRALTATLTRTSAEAVEAIGDLLDLLQVSPAPLPSPCASSAQTAEGLEWAVLDPRTEVDPPPLPPLPVLNGHAASLPPY